LHWCTGRTNILAHAVVPRFNFSANPIHWGGGGGGGGYTEPNIIKIPKNFSAGL
jgi:hypothetical protein